MGGLLNFFWGEGGVLLWLLLLMMFVIFCLFGFFNYCFFVSDYRTLLQLIVLPVKAIDK